jgi:hypothetical protein
VLSPASLTAGINIHQQEGPCSNVSTLNFTHEAIYNYRDETTFRGASLVFYNTTNPQLKQTSQDDFDYYDQPSKNTKRLCTTSAYLKKPVYDTSQAVSSCESGWNCTYSIQFTGPGYKCDELASGIDINNNIQQLTQMSAPFNLSDLAPFGDYIYKAEVDDSDYVDPQAPSTDKGTPVGSPPWPDLLGVFQYEPPLWIGYSIKSNDSWPSDSPFAKSNWTTVHTPKIFKCEHYETDYTVFLNFSEGVQSATVTNRTFLHPIVNTTQTPNLADPSRPILGPPENFIRPNTDPLRYKRTASYHALGIYVRNFLRGDISYPGYPLTRSDISETRLINSQTSYPVDDLMNATQSFYEDMIITLLSEPHLIVADKASVSCVRSRVLNVYKYHASSLWIGYAIVVAVALIFLIVGGLSIYANGVSSDTYFSRIMVTTRNPTLDRLSVGACLGGDPFPQELRRTKLRFGVLIEDDEERDISKRVDGVFGQKIEHCTFGTEGETKDIRKYGTYAGLKRYRCEDTVGKESIDLDTGNLDEKTPLI